MSSVTYNNIFDAITDSSDEAAELQNRANLMISIRDTIASGIGSQKEFVNVPGLTQARISDLRYGKIEKLPANLLVSINSYLKNLCQ